MNAEYKLSLDTTRMNEYQARRELAKQLNPLKDDQYVIGEDEIKYRDLATSMVTQINEDKVEL